MNRRDLIKLMPFIPLSIMGNIADSIQPDTKPIEPQQPEIDYDQLAKAMWDFPIHSISAADSIPAIMNAGALTWPHQDQDTITEDAFFTLKSADSNYLPYSETDTLFTLTKKNT